MTHSHPLKQISKQCSQLLLLCVQQEEMFVPYPLHTLRNQAGNVCHSKPFPIPGSKSEIQQISVRRWEWVTLVLCVSLISTCKYTAKNEIDMIIHIEQAKTSRVYKAQSILLFYMYTICILSNA